VFVAGKIMEQENDVDETLLPYLDSVNEAGEREHLDHLLNTIARPIVLQTFQRNFQRRQIKDAYGTGPLDIQDAISEVLVKLLQRLRTFKADPSGQAITNFRGLVTTTAYRSLTDQLRGHHRHRASQDKKVRRFFAADRNLALWKDNEGTMLCGYACWRKSRVSEESPTADLLLLADGLRADGQERDTGALILLLLEKIGRPVKFNDLISAVTWERLESETVAIETMLTDDTRLVSSALEPHLALEAKSLAEGLFQEIGSLEPAQRQALLLNMKDSHGYSIEWFLFANIATEEQLAELLEIPVEGFMKLMHALPMTDKEIGRRIGIEAMKVANMRKAVRDRLERFRRSFSGQSRRTKR